MDRDKQVENKEEMIAVKLDADRRREINDIRSKFEQFYRDEIKFQADMKNKMDIVSNKQDSLKERFESGTAATLRELRKDFSVFLMEWGKKQEQDRLRDEKLNSVEKLASKNSDNHMWLVRSLIVSVCGGILLAVILYAFQNFRI